MFSTLKYMTMALSSVAASAGAATAMSTTVIATTHNNNHNLNRKWILKRRPSGVFNPKLDAEFVEMETATITATTTGNNNKNKNKNDSDGESSRSSEAADETSSELSIEDHQIVVEPQLLSVDAFLRTMMDEGAYHSTLPIGAPLPALGYGKVVKAGPKSGHSVGTTVSGMLTASDKAIVDGKNVVRSFKFPFLKRSASLGLLGLTTGLTAYTGVFYVPTRPPRAGETVVVTGAAGAVGSIAVQLCKSTGARVVGIAGGTKKGEYLRETLGCDGVIDYKNVSTKSLADQIAETCPNGIDFVYDNVGGETLDALMDKINPNARIVICGAISQYSGNLNGKDKAKKVQGPSNYLKLAERGAEMKGFNVMQHIAKLPRMLFGMFYLWARGKVAMKEHVENGLERFPYALQKLFTGETIGKTLVRIRSDDP